MCSRLLRVLVVVIAFPAAAEDAITFSRDTLDVVTTDNRSWTFQVDLAVTPAQRSRGLMFRETMADDEGMLFLYVREAPRGFWMKNTFLPLDIIFLDRHGIIVSIAADARPLDETTIHSAAPAPPSPGRSRSRPSIPAHRRPASSRCSPARPGGWASNLATA